MAPSGKTSAPERASDKDKALEAALAQIERQFGKGSVMRLGQEARAPVEVIPTGSIALDVALGIGGLPARPRRGDLRTGEYREDYHRAARRRQRAEVGRHRRLHRRRARARPRVREEARRRHRRAAGLPAGQRRAGAGDRRHADPFRRARRRGDRLGGGPGAQGGDRGRDGRQPRRPAGPPHVPGAPQAHRRNQLDQDHGHLHQPASREGRRDVRLAGDDDRRQGAEVLRVGPARRPADRDAEGRDRGGRQPDPGQGREEQDGPAVQGRRVRHPLRDRDLAGRAA